MNTHKQLIKFLKELREKEKLNQMELSVLEFLIRGKKAILEDRIISHSEAKKRVSYWLN